MYKNRKRQIPTESLWQGLHPRTGSPLCKIHEAPLLASNTVTFFFRVVESIFKDALLHSLCLKTPFKFGILKNTRL